MMRRGFTLIELLIVIALMMIVLSLVGPLGQVQVDKSRAAEEWLRFQHEVSARQKNAYLQGQSMLLKFNGKTMSVETAGVDNGQVIEFLYVFFEPQQIIINSKGFSEPEQITAVVRGNQREFNFAVVSRSGKQL